MRALLLVMVLAAPIGVSAKEPTCPPTPAVLINHAPRNGFVPDAATAIKIAIAIWLPIYGKEVLEEKPFRARLEHGVWTVRGSLPPGMVGGVAEARICKSDASIVYVAHGK